jgi:glucose/arabinose dehydrogenase
MKLRNLLAGLLITVQAVAQVPTLTLTQVGSGFTRITTLANAGDDRLFVCEKAGIIKFFRPYQGATSTTFMDINSKVFNPTGDSDERGLLGLTFDPNYATNGRFYVNYINNTGNTVIARYTVTAGNADAGNVSSEEIILTVTQPYSNHNGGCILFGPDGFLYIGMGDGGSGGDPQNNAQNRQSLLGKMLRIDVSGTGPGYTIPASNPFTIANDPTNTTLDEIWAVGVRNPWRYSFDSQSGDMWIADVGQNLYEEINFQPATSNGGENYGWRCYEGANTYNTTGCQAQSNYAFPIYNFAHSSGACSVTGGYVYRGNLYEDIYARYFFTDYCDGIIRSTFDNGIGGWTTESHGAFTAFQYTAFGEDAYGEVYIARQSGIIARLTIAASDPRAPINADGPLSFCAGSSVNLSTGFNPLLTYAWYKDNTVISGATQATFEATEAGVYKVMTTSANGTKESTTLTLEILPAPSTPSATISQTNICEDQAFAIALNGTPAGGTFTGEGVTDGSFNPFNLGAGTYPVEYRVTGANGCASAPFVLDVVINPLPTVSLSGFDAEYCLDSPLATPVFSPAGGTLNGPGVAVNGTSFNPALAGAGQHVVNYTFADAIGCANTASATITVDACLSAEEITANNYSISPNPFKETFQITFNDAAVKNITVFNAIGQAIITEANFSGSKYTASLETQPAGVYFLVVEQNGKTGSTKLIKQ